MNIIHTMPKIFGEQFFPHGFPVPFENINVYGISIKDRFIKQVEAPDAENEAILKDYVLYYLHAPIFKIDRTGLEGKTYDELMDFCFDNGIDPF